MDTQSTVIGMVIALICCLPFIIFALIKRKQNQALKMSLKTFSENNNFTIGEYEICNNTIIGNNKNSDFIFFIKNDQITVIDLKLTTGCNLKTVRSDNQKAILYVDIVFDQFTNKKIILNVFNDDTDPPLNGEIPFAEKWINTINKSIKLKAA